VLVGMAEVVIREGNKVGIRTGLQLLTGVGVYLFREGNSKAFTGLLNFGRLKEVTLSHHGIQVTGEQEIEK